MGTESQGKTALLIYEWQDFNKIGTISNMTGEVTDALKLALLTPLQPFRTCFSLLDYIIIIGSIYL